ncbi:MAG: efflux RND transporter periplasmic adaptor subunit [Chitinophagia bacterium]|jgi:cobalt-zinc-cadmium efflux system membrane fusion protein
MNQLISIRIIISTILIGLIGITSSGCKSPVESEEKQATVSDQLVSLTRAQLNNAQLAIGTIQQQPITSVVRVKGKIDLPPQKMMSVSVPLGGYLKSSNLLVGMRVEKGEVIAVVEGEQYIQLQQDYLMAKEKLVWLEQEFKRQRELQSSQSTSQRNYQQAAADYSAQQVLVSALFQKLKLVGIDPVTLTKDKISASIPVRAGISGYVAAVHVNAGKYINPSDILFELISTDDIHLALKVFEKDIPNLQIGQTVQAFTNQQPEKKYSCKIILLGKEIGEDRSIEIHCHFLQAHVPLLPGTYMNAEIEIKNQAATVLPDAAVVRYNNRNFLFIQSDSLHFVMKEVEVGISENGFTQLLNSEGLRGNKIVTKGSYTLLMALKNKSEE